MWSRTATTIVRRNHAMARVLPIRRLRLPTLRKLHVDFSRDSIGRNNKVGWSCAHQGRRWQTTGSIYDDDDDDETPKQNGLLYESPFGGLVTRLRAVTLMTGFIGSVGLPVVIHFGSTNIPTGGFLAIAIAFGTTTLGSTAAIHYVFSPYVFSIERIARNSTNDDAIATGNDDVSLKESPVDEASATKQDDDSLKESPVDEASATKQDYTYRAITKTIFVRPIETIFDAEDMIKYKGFYMPMCNFEVQGRPMYVHPEMLYEEALRTKLNEIRGADATDTRPLSSKNNPDDDLF